MFFLTFGIFSTVVVFNKPLTQLTRAKEDIIPSGSKSLIFAWPLTVQSDGKKTSTITVFVRTAKSKPLINKTITLNSTLGDIKNKTAITDKEGKAVFELSSQNKGIAKVEAVIDNTIKITQTITIKFE